MTSLSIVKRWVWDGQKCLTSILLSILFLFLVYFLANSQFDDEFRAIVLSGISFILILVLSYLLARVKAPVELKNEHLKTLKDLQTEKAHLQHQLIPILTVGPPSFKKKMHYIKNQVHGVTYDLLIQCRNPRESGRSISGVNPCVLEAEKEWGDLSGSRLQFVDENNVVQPETRLFNPGDDKQIVIANFSKDTSGSIRATVRIFTPGGLGKNIPIKNKHRLTFRVSCENQQAQEWEIRLGFKNNELWAIATQKFPLPINGDLTPIEARMPLDPDTPYSSTQ